MKLLVEGKKHLIKCSRELKSYSNRIFVWQISKSNSIKCWHEFVVSSLFNLRYRNASEGKNQRVRGPWENYAARRMEEKKPSQKWKQHSSVPGALNWRSSTLRSARIKNHFESLMRKQESEPASHEICFGPCDTELTPELANNLSFCLTCVITAVPASKCNSTFEPFVTHLQIN